MVSIVVAMSSRGLIGNNGKLPFHNSVDMQRFKKRTLNHQVVMGRKTWDSLPKPLMLRDNIVLSRNRKLSLNGAASMSLQQFIQDELPRANKEVFIIGGAEIYRLFLHLADKLYITLINGDFEGNIYFPDYDKSKWKLINTEVSAEGNCSFLEYDKIN